MASSGTPYFAARARAPSASSAPMPSRLAISSRRLDVAVDLAEAQAEVVDALLGEVHGQADDGAASRWCPGPTRRTAALNFISASMSPMPQLAPQRAMVSYSGPSPSTPPDLVELAAADGALVAGAVLGADLLEGVGVDVLDAARTCPPTSCGSGSRRRRS